MITEGIKYAGSKKKIIPYILEEISSLKGTKSVLDGFSGTTRVSQALAQLGYDITANDISVWSEVFGRCYLTANKSDGYYQELIDYLNSLKGYEGWFTTHYGTDNLDVKKPFQQKNTEKLDAIRDEIDKLQLDRDDECVLLTSLIYALDKVDNTLGHYAAYLSKWSARSHNNLKLQLPKRFSHSGNNRVIQGDIFDTIAENKFDLAYFDPPYGSNNEKMPPSRIRYASYYHIWTTVILNDKPELFGKANRRVDSRDQIASSVFEDFRKDEDDKFVALNAIEKLIKKTDANNILISYSSGGRATKKELSDIITSSGKLLKALEIDYRHNVMSQMRWTNEWVNSNNAHKEYLFLMEKK